MNELKNKVALITGGSRGIGRAIAKTLAGQGARVAISYGSSADAAEKVVGEIERGGGDALAVQADARDKAAQQKLVSTVAERFGGIDILVHNAGVFIAKPVADFSDEEFEQTLDVNVRAVYYTTKYALAHLRDDARIIVLSSVIADRVPFPGGSVYALSKAAVAAFTKGLSRDLADRRITVNAVQPGPIDTDMNPADGEMADYQRSLTALGRYGQAQEVADAVAFLASEKAAFVTGTTLDVDGGFNA